MGLKGIIVNGDTYKLDYSALDNLPDLPEPVVLPEHTANDKGKSLVVDEGGEWTLGKAIPVPQARDANLFLSVDFDGNWTLRSLASTVEVSPLPYVDSYNAGDVLAVSNEGGWISRNLLSVLAQDDIDGDSALEHCGKAAVVNSQGKLALSDFSIVDLYETVVSLSSRLSQLEERVAPIASGNSDTQITVTNDKITLNGSGVSMTGDKLSVTGSDFTVNGEKLSIA